tara:strand:+ start:3266 stop:3523 length:258 start_codon:yes stop_codon:yes gene_type:complete
MLQSQTLAHEIRRTNRRLLDDIFADQMLPIGTEQTHNDPINEPHFFVIQIRGIPQSFYLAFGMGKIVFVLFFMLYMWKCFISLNS